MKLNIIRIPVDARALQTVNLICPSAIFESARPRSTEQTHTVSLRIMSENALLIRCTVPTGTENCCRRTRAAPFARQTRARRTPARGACGPHRATRPKHKKRCARARQASDAALHSLSPTLPLRSQNDFQDSCAHLVFCMESAKSIPRPDVT